MPLLENQLISLQTESVESCETSNSIATLYNQILITLHTVVSAGGGGVCCGGGGGDGLSVESGEGMSNLGSIIRNKKRRF